MNILITNIDGKPEFIGGIKRVSAILGNEWKVNHNVCFLSFCTSPIHFDTIESIPQYFLPNSENITDIDNLNFFCDFVLKNSIDIILHQFSDDVEMSNLCIKVKQQTGVKLISTLHFAVTHEKDIIESVFFAPLKMKYSSSKNRIKTLFSEMLFFISYHLRSKYRKKELFSNSIKNIYSDSDSFVLLSDSQKNIFKTYIKLDNITKLTAINNPINCDMSITENTIIDKKNKLLWCGRVEYGQKRLDRMIEVWKKITVEYPEWELIVIGGGSTDYFENIVKTEMIPNVYFTGFTNPEKWYSEGDILCMTSSSEGWGMVLVEAMMHGCVPIAYDSFTAIDDIILDGYNGFKIPSYKKDLFIERLKYLMEDKSLRHQLSKNGIKYIERFDKKKIAAKWIALFEKVLSE